MALSKERTKLIERLRHPRFRPREGSFLVEGVRGVGEMIAGTQAERVRFALHSPRVAASTAGQEVMGLIARSGIATEEVSDQELAALSDTEQSQGVLLVVEEPKTGFLDLVGFPHPRLLLLDGIQDPGNAGTLIRSAWAFGMTGVVAMEGTVDLFNAKVVRAASGALGHIPVARASWGEVETWTRREAVPLLVADSSGEDVRAVGPLVSWSLVIGNEGAGPRPEVTQAADKVVAIPMNPGVDSLNAGLAGAILLFALNPSTAEGTGI